MDVILHPSNDPFEHNLILKGENPTVVGEITQRNDTGTIKHNQIVLGVNWLVDPKTLVPEQIDELGDYLNLRINNLNMVQSLPAITNYITTDKGLFTSVNDADMKTLIQAVINDTRAIFVVTSEEYTTVERAIRVGSELQALYTAYPIYTKIIQMDGEKPVLVSILDLIFQLDEHTKDDFLMAISYANGLTPILKTIAERILTTVKPESGLSLMTQEQQVEGFIQFSKLIADETHELVTDETLDAMRKSDVYQRITSDLKEQGFGLSETQQFNSLQSAAYLGADTHKQNVLYNLSDMGAGKTLMTVESIFLMDLKTIKEFNQSENYDTIIKQIKTIQLPKKNLIAPKLSIKSSWIKTFELFYNVKKITDNEYALTFEYDGAHIVSTLNIAAFTVKSSTLTIDDSLPEPEAKREYLIIDEVHQLAERKLNRSRFFAKGVSPSERYKSFVLSGTLSNLTTREWLNYIMFMNIPFNHDTLDNRTPNQLSDKADIKKGEILENIIASAENIELNQRRRFDTDAFDKPQMAISNEKRLTNKNEVFHLLYSSKVLKIDPKRGSLYDNLTNGTFSTKFDFSISDTPNFELFYNIVGTCAITAQSTQIAEELFGEQKLQHNADVINVDSPLSGEDIHLLRVLHQITKDHQIYKSPRIATAINNAILNLNDGLANKNVYDILSKYAQSNTRFLTYLSGLDLDILEKLKQSNLIAQPEIKDTQKFKIIQDILAREITETHLIVVNDADAMIKLSKALSIQCFTKKELKDPLNYQDILDELFEKQSIVIVPQMMIKSSLDIVQANRLIQYQLNTEISDIIQTQNRINRIGQTRETKAYYIATDVLQKNIIELFLETYKNIRVAHKGIVELFVDMSSQVNVINDYISKAMTQITHEDITKVTNTSLSNEPLTFDSDGIGYLFPIEHTQTDYQSADMSSNQDHSVWFDFTDRNQNQRSLFSPTDKAFMHQMVPCMNQQVI